MRYTSKAAVVLGTASLLIGPTAVVQAGPAADPGLLGSVWMGLNTHLSAAVYDERGQVVRHLYELAPKSGTVSLRWDGKDDWGYDLPSRKYNWRAATSSVVGTHDGQVGDRAKAAPGYAYEASEHPGMATALAYGPDGDLYLTSVYEEIQRDVRRIAKADLATGKITWGMGGWHYRGHAIAVDGNHVYVASHASSDLNDKNYVVSRLDARTGAAVGFGQDKKRIPVMDDWVRGKMPVTGLAVDSAYLWVIDAANQKLKVFTKDDGEPAHILGGTNEMTIASPRGIVTDGANRFWIVSGNDVVKYIYDPVAGSLTPQTRIVGLNSPYGVALHQSTLYVSERETGHVRKYDVSGASPVERAVWFGSMPAAGRVTDTTFGWRFDTASEVPGGDAAIAVSPDGRTLSVVDVWNGRTMFYDTANGSVLPTRFEGVNTPAVDVDVAVGSDLLMSNGREYKVQYGRSDPDYGRPWKLQNNWMPTDDPNSLRSPFGMVTRKLRGIEYLYVFLMQRCSGALSNCPNAGPFPYGGILVYRLNADGPDKGMKKVAQIRRKGPGDAPRNVHEFGPELLETSADTNGNGNLEDDPVTTSRHKAYISGNPSAWVDSQGTIWLASTSILDNPETASVRYGVGKLPLRGFDQRANPVYDVADLDIRDPVDSDTATKTVSPYEAQVRYDVTNQRLFTAAETGEFAPNANYGGDGVVMRDFRTGQRSVFSGYSQTDGPRYGWRDTVTALAVDTKGGYFYTGGTTGGAMRITMHSWDGLRVGQADTRLPVYGSGLIDHGWSLTAFSHFDGTRYVYAKDNGYGYNTRFAFTDADFVRRHGSDPSTGSTAGDFVWSGKSTADDLVGWWRFDAGRHAYSGVGMYVADSSRNGHWGVFERDNDVTSWWQPDGVHHGALNFAGRQATAVHFRQNTWGAKPDNMVDNPAYASLTFASWVKTTGSGVVIGYQNAAATSSVPLVYVGEDGLLHAGAKTAPGCAKPQAVSPEKVNDGQWHHVTLTVGESGQALFLDGRQVDETNCGMVREGLGYTHLGKGNTTLGTGTWPSTPGGYFHFVGSLDDTRLYRRALSADEVSSLAQKPAPAGPWAHWKLDETRGTTAADSADHGKDGVVGGGTWQPAGGCVGGALAFDGNTRVTLPDSMTGYPPLTVSAWAKPGKDGGGVVLGDQRGPYPSEYVRGIAVEGVGPMSTKAIEIASDGTVHSSLMNTALGGPGKSPDIRDDQWHHIAVTTSMRIRGTEALFTTTLYLDGTPIDSRTDDPQGIWAAVRPDNQLGVGRYTDGAWAHYKGLLDDVRVYSRTLTAAEVAALAGLSCS